MYFKKALVKEYGEQIWRDADRAKQSYDSASYSSALVVRGCGFIPNTDKAEENFRQAILKYARETPRPQGFI